MYDILTLVGAMEDLTAVMGHRHSLMVKDYPPRHEDVKFTVKVMCANVAHIFLTVNSIFSCLRGFSFAISVSR